MKSFSFSLQAVLDWRRRQLEAAEARLSEIGQRQAELRDRLAVIQAKIEALGLETLSQRVCTAKRLRDGDKYAQHLRRNLARAQQQEAQYAAEHREHLRQAIEIRRKMRLLEILRSRQFRNHETQLKRTLEQEIADIHLGGRIRRNMF